MIDFNYGVHLRAICVEDLHQMIKWRNNPLIWAWCRQNDVISWEHHLRWFQSLPDRQDVKMYAIEADNKLLGVCGLTDISMTNRRAEFSLYIGPEFQKMGYATKSLKTLLDHAFRNLGLNVVWGETFDQNPAISVFVDVGMVLEGTRRQFYFRGGRFIDAHLYSITRDEWDMKRISDLSAEHLPR